MAAPSAKDLVQKFDGFRQRGRDLVADVRSQLPALLESGRPLSMATLQEMTAYKQFYIAICEFAWPNRSAPVGAPTFEHFERRIAEMGEAPVRRPVDVLSSLVAAPGSEGLLEAIRRTINASPDGEREHINAVAGDLLLLISKDESVSDEHWQQLLDRVTALFGREVAFGAARGKLTHPTL